MEEAVLTVVAVSNQHVQVERELQNVLKFITETWPDLPVLDYRIEFI